MPAVSDELLKQLATRSQGRNPAFQHQSTVDPASVPEVVGDAGSGINVANSVVTLVRVVQRLYPASRYGEVKITGIDAQQYRITVNGSNTDYTAAPADTEEDIVDGLVAAFAVANMTATKGEESRFFPGSEFFVALTGDTPTIFSTLATSIVGGPGAATIEDAIESENCTVRLYALGKNLGDLTVPTLPDAKYPHGSLKQFDAVNGTPFTLIDGENLIERVESAGLEEIKLVAEAADGFLELVIGPCSLEYAAEAT